MYTIQYNAKNAMSTLRERHHGKQFSLYLFTLHRIMLIKAMHTNVLIHLSIDMNCDEPINST